MDSLYGPGRGGADNRVCPEGLGEKVTGIGIVEVAMLIRHAREFLQQDDDDRSQRAAHLCQMAERNLGEAYKILEGIVKEGEDDLLRQ
jgi:hypothetical protein